MSSADESASLCRICLLPCENQHSFALKFEVDTENVSVSKMFSGCSGLEVSMTDTPSHICDDCIVDLIKCYRFRRKCQEAHCTILLLSSKKTEPIETDLEILVAEEVDDTTFEDTNFDDDTDEMIIHTSSVPNTPEKTSLVTKKTSFSRSIMRRRFKCPLCPSNIRFDNSICQRAHRIFVHEKSGQCDKCHKKFITYRGLAQHLLTHDQAWSGASTRTRMKQRPTKRFMCDICGLYMVQHSKLLEHMRTHTGERPFKCEECDYTAAQKSSLVAHMRTHTGERPFKCRICEKYYSTSGHRATHEKTHRTERPYECLVCGKTFKVRCIWKEHMLIHQPELHKTCEYCGKTFSRDDNYKIHLRLHTGAQPYSCKICGKKFNQRHCLVTHYKNNHDGHMKSE